MLAQHAGAARWAFNYALGRKDAAHKAFSAARDALLDGIVDPAAEQMAAVTAAARSQVGRIPGSIDNLKTWRAERGDDRAGVGGVSPWWHTVSSYAISSGMRDADAAFQAWFDSRAGRRAGRGAGYPRFKRKGRSRDSFTLYHDVKRPTIRVVDARHVLLPRIGTVRLHSNLRRLIRLQGRDELQVRSVTVSRQGGRWYASILIAHPAPAVKPTRRQTAAGTIGVDLGVKTAATLSDGTVIPNPRWGNAAHERLTKAQRVYARTRRGSANRAKAARRVATLQARLAEQRTSWIHQVTKQLATGWVTIAIEDLNVAGMTRTARGTAEQPGRRVRQKAGLNRAILDVGFGEFRRQLTYKSSWYGAQLVVVDRWLPSSRTCSACGWHNPDLTLADRTYRCGQCGLSIDRDLNAAINIAAAAAQTTDPSREGRPMPGRPGTGQSPTPATSGAPRRHIGCLTSQARPRPDPAMTQEDHHPPGGGHPSRVIGWRPTRRSLR